MHPNVSKRLHRWLKEKECVPNARRAFRNNTSSVSLGPEASATVATCVMQDIHEHRNIHDRRQKKDWLKGPCFHILLVTLPFETGQTTSWFVNQQMAFGYCISETHMRAMHSARHWHPMTIPFAFADGWAEPQWMPGMNILTHDHLDGPPCTRLQSKQHRDRACK